MDYLQQEQFTKALLGLVDRAKTKKNVLEYSEINDAFRGMELSEDKMDLVLEYLEKQNIDIMNTSVEAGGKVDDLLLAYVDGDISFSVYRQTVQNGDKGD